MREAGKMKQLAFRSRKGVSLVEEICAVCILAIGVFAAVSLIGLSRVSVTSDSMKEAAAAQAQQLGDNLIADLSQNPNYVPPGSVTVRNVGGISAADVCRESALGMSGYDRQYCVTQKTSDLDGQTEGYAIICRVYYNGRKNYVQFHAYASARGTS